MTMPFNEGTADRVLSSALSHIVFNNTCLLLLTFEFCVEPSICVSKNFFTGPKNPLFDDVILIVSFFNRFFQGSF